MRERGFPVLVMEDFRFAVDNAREIYDSRCDGRQPKRGALSERTLK